MTFQVLVTPDNTAVSVEPNVTPVKVTTTMVVATGPRGAGVASGGTAGQVLTKVSDTDNDTEFRDLPVVDVTALSATWNDAGTDFTGIGLDVTNTASGAGSNLLDLKIGGNSAFSVAKNGNIRVAQNVRWFLGTTGVSPFMQIGSTAIKFNHTRALAWTSSADASAVEDLALYRDAANTLAQRRGTNPQAFNLYNSWTDPSNYERGFMRWNANVLEIGTEAAGTGTARNLLFKSNLVKFQNTANGFVSITDANSPQIIIQQSTGLKTVIDPLKYTMPESSSAPAGTVNSAVIFAEDDGTGKTRLMIQFGTGAAVQIAIEP